MQAYKILSVIAVVLAVISLGLFGPKPIWAMGAFFSSVFIGLVAGFLWETSDDYVASRYFR